MCHATIRKASRRQGQITADQRHTLLTDGKPAAGGSHFGITANGFMAAESVPSAIDHRIGLKQRCHAVDLAGMLQRSHPTRSQAGRTFFIVAAPVLRVSD
ncbi:hypothetical protein [Mesorhizobium sp. M8A.F.Ca.ET.021.01.1.1]|uniref:hypothetical protein n=1 Tax=Mesorhizobium sp. M8A.F.Ca.ET.021.01.1.1 TaxID=2496757 RepID=UPI001676C8F2|nr:hypothetical protein [Mesorhizobium sp. M8A.F.Ca.ET.021.01.1.1]